MPELPEVETVVKALKGHGLLKEKIKKTEVFCPSLIVPFSSKEFESILKEQPFKSITRRGKFIIFSFDSSWFLLIHLKMSGRFFLKSQNEELKKHEHILFHLSSGKVLCFHDTRKFGKLILTKNPEEILRKLGPEPLSKDWKKEEFYHALKKSKKSLKTTLLDQSFLAGLGNIYVDECLWRAQLHPLRKAFSLTKKEAMSLHGAIQETLKKGLKYKGTSLGKGAPNFHQVNGQIGSHQNHLWVYGREDLPCLRCQNTVRKMFLNGRGTHFCPTCQLILKSSERKSSS